MADIIDFERARTRLRPWAPANKNRSFLVLEIPENIAKEMNKADAINVFAQFDFLVHR